MRRWIRYFKNPLLLFITQVGKLFDRFFTVEAARNSNGLGLSIAKTLVEQMGGRITAQLLNNKLSIIIEFHSGDR